MGRKWRLDRGLTTQISYFCDDGSQFLVARCCIRVRGGIKEHYSTNLMIYTIPSLRSIMETIARHRWDRLIASHIVAPSSGLICKIFHYILKLWNIALLIQRVPSQRFSCTDRHVWMFLTPLCFLLVITLSRTNIERLEE